MNQESKPLDLHEVCREQRACGYDNDLHLRSRDVQTIATRVRGIQAISAVLLVDDSLDCTLGAHLRYGLVGAIHALAADIDADFEQANEAVMREHTK
ncbi:hypothetical protein [Hydrogenophaga sp. NFH-34]|uniref:hypothetical protein n=1 Tax=Hydrogenophaga sp. NFH-34 TaxID=2744446 RepID=UPI001F464AC7|nr:hypothetical protein [Hydrogenophaga sp. NFH-34]